MSSSKQLSMFQVSSESESGPRRLLADSSDRVRVLRGTDLEDVGALFAYVSLGREHHAVSKEARGRATSTIGKGRRNRVLSPD